MKSDFVIGLSRDLEDPLEARVSLCRQEATIRKFHNKELNLLFATSVLEEGLDVPSCNLVIRFDSISNYPSFVQSRGRARQDGAKFYVLLKQDEYDKEMEKIQSFKDYSETLAKYLIQHAIHADDDCYDHMKPFEEKEDDGIAPYAPYGPTGPQILSTEAIPIVYQYVILFIQLY